MLYMVHCGIQNQANLHTESGQFAPKQDDILSMIVCKTIGIIF